MIRPMSKSRSYIPYLITDECPFKPLYIRKTSDSSITGSSVILLYISMHFSIECSNHPAAFPIILLSLLLYLHPNFMLSFVHLVPYSVGSMHGLFHFACVRHTVKRVDSESFLSGFCVTH